MLIKRKLLPTGDVFFNINPASGRPGAVSQKHLQYKLSFFGRSAGNIPNNGDCVLTVFELLPPKGFSRAVLFLP